MTKVTTQDPGSLPPEQLLRLAYRVAGAALAGRNTALSAARANGVERGLIVVRIDSWESLPTGALVVRGRPGFQTIDDVQELRGLLRSTVERTMQMLDEYHPAHEIVVAILVPSGVHAFRIGRNTRALTA